MFIAYTNSKKNAHCSFASFILIIVFIGFASVANANYTNIHTFSTADYNGQYPYGSLTLSDDNSSFYGMTYEGGDGDGVIFKVDIDGNNYTNLHNFAGGDDDGKNPFGSLTLSGSVLYGMTCDGGTSTYGVIFKVDIDGSNYTNLHDFAGGNDNGARPYGNLTLSDGVFYGMTYDGGDGYGVIFKMNIDGNNYTNLHNFAGGDNDGQSPYGSLTLSGSVLYGMTIGGGTGSVGVIFKMDTDGSDYTNLHNFAGGNADGRTPCGNLTLSGGVLYGMTFQGGTNDTGIIFKMDIDGNNYTNLHDFAGGNDDGANPRGSLIISGDSLAGMTSEGGNNLCGVIFRIGLNGNNYTNLHEFTGGANDGDRPYFGKLLEYNGYFYGMTHDGGASSGDGEGVIFKQLVPEPTFFGILFIFGGFFFRTRKS